MCATPCPSLEHIELSPDLSTLQSFAELKTELVQQGQKYAAEAISFRDKIAEATLGFIKDDSVVRRACWDAPDKLTVHPEDTHPFLLTCGHESLASCP